MALHTAFTFFILALGLFFAIPEAPFARVFAGQDSRGVIARQLLPLSILLTLVLGWLRLWGERQGYFEAAFGTVLFAILLCLLLTILLRWTISTIDRLERKRAETQARLDYLNRRKDEMVAFVSHDLCSPLTGLRMVIDLLRAGNGKPADDLLDLMDHSTRRLVSMVRGLVDLTKAGSEEARLEYSELRVSELVRHSMEPLLINAGAKRIHVDLEVVGEEPVIHADSLRITQIFNNLLSNAVKFTPDGGRITISIEPAYAGVRVKIKDTGVGIAENDLPHVFDRYYQGGTKATGGEAGQGLGLAIVRQMVELHDGYINVTSEPGQGTTFTVFLPDGIHAAAA